MKNKKNFFKTENKIIKTLFFIFYLLSLINYKLLQTCYCIDNFNIFLIKKLNQ